MADLYSMAMGRALRASDIAEDALFERDCPPTGETCPCADLAGTAHSSGWPRCDGRLHAYPSGNVACDCGEHVQTPVAV